MLKTVLHIAQDERSSLTLRSVAETTLVDMTRSLFDRADAIIAAQQLLHEGEARPDSYDGEVSETIHLLWRDQHCTVVLCHVDI